MALNFPNTPVDGDTFNDFVFDGTKNAWRSVSDNTAMVIPSPTPPVDAPANAIWLDTNDMSFLTRFNDGSSTQWVEMQNPSTYIESVALASTNARVATLENIENTKAYAQINKTTGQAFGSGFMTITLDEILFAKNIQLVSNQIRFSYPGVYRVTAGMRFANDAGDSWTGLSLYNATAGRVGISYGTGNVSGDPGPVEFSFFAQVTNVSVDYALQLYRAGSVMTQLTPAGNAGKAIAATIEKVS